MYTLRLFLYFNYKGLQYLKKSGKALLIKKNLISSILQKSTLNGNRFGFPIVLIISV